MWTLESLHQLAKYAVATDKWRPAINWEERVDAAYCAIVALVWSVDETLSVRELVYAGREASADVVDQDMKHRGVDKRRDRLGETRVNFARYWTSLPGDPLEDRVIDRLGLHQIWGRLTPSQQDALLALATWGGYAEASEQLGLRYHTFCQRIQVARRRFLELWHEGETPSSLWGRDRRVGRDNTGRTAVRVHARQARLLQARCAEAGSESGEV